MNKFLVGEGYAVLFVVLSFGSAWITWTAGMDWVEKNKKENSWIVFLVPVASIVAFALGTILGALLIGFVENS